MFFTFFKLYERYQIAQSITDDKFNQVKSNHTSTFVAFNDFNFETYCIDLIWKKNIPKKPSDTRVLANWFKFNNNDTYDDTKNVFLEINGLDLNTFEEICLLGKFY